MAYARKPRRSSSASLAQSGPRAGYHPDSPQRAGCVATNACTRDVLPDCPVALCSKHARQVYLHVHDIVTAELDRQATRVD